MNGPTQDTLELILVGMTELRAESPRSRNLVLMLGVAFGRLCGAMLQGRATLAKEEAMRMACIALRIYEEGETTLISLSGETRMIQDGENDPRRVREQR